MEITQPWQIKLGQISINGVHCLCRRKKNNGGYSAVHYTVCHAFQMRLYFVAAVVNHAQIVSIFQSRL